MEEAGAEWSTFYRRGLRFTVYHRHDHTASLESLKMEHHCWHCPLSHPSLLMRKQVNSVSTISSASSLPFHSNIKDFITHLMSIIIIIANADLDQYLTYSKYLLLVPLLFFFLFTKSFHLGLLGRSRCFFFFFSLGEEGHISNIQFYNVSVRK